MDIDTARIRELLDQRDAIDQELTQLILGEKERKLRCSRCGSDSHTARKCPEKEKPE